MADYKVVIARLQQFKRDIPVLVGNEMVNYALDNLRAQAYLGVPYAQRKAGSKRNSGRRLLIDTGDGERSIRISASNSNYVELTANDYMEAHNTGVNKSVTVRSHRRTRKGRATHEVASHERTMKLPTRTFIAPDNVLDKRILKTLEIRFKKIVS
jgi:phage gpG-like protein